MKVLGWIVSDTWWERKKETCCNIYIICFNYAKEGLHLLEYLLLEENVHCGYIKVHAASEEPEALLDPY